MDGAVYVVTKNYAGHSKVLRYQPPFDPATTRVLEVVVDDLPFNPSSATPNDRLATAADISPTGREILIKTYNQTYLWRRASGQSVADALRQSRCQVTHPGGSEAIAFSADESRYYSLTEGSGSLLYQVPRL